MIQLSPTAAQEILRLQRRRSDSNLRFRLKVESAGCLGLLYGMDFDPHLGPDDRVYECSGVQVVVDADSWRWVRALKVDYSEDLMGGGFRFDNPAVTQTCGCGNSFAVSDEA